jgi:hypothetical protein
VSEGPFYAVALAMEGAVEVALDLAHGTRRNDGLDAAFAEMAEDRVSIVALVGEHRFGPVVSEQRDGLRAIVGLTASQHEAEGQAKRIGEQMDLGRQTTSTPPQSGLRSPFFRAVAACW